MPRPPRLLPILLASRKTTPDALGQLWNAGPAHGPQRTVPDDVLGPTDQIVATGEPRWEPPRRTTLRDFGLVRLPCLCGPDEPEAARARSAAYPKNAAILTLTAL